MGKKRERELQERIDALTARDSQAREDAETRMVAAMREMAQEPFIIITKTGHLVRARVLDVQMNQPTATTGNGVWLSTFPTGPREYTAHITIEPIK